MATGIREPSRSDLSDPRARNSRLTRAGAAVTNEDEPQLHQLSSLVDRLAATQVERIVSEVFDDVLERARPMIRGMLLEELVRRLTDESSPARGEQVAEASATLATVEEELAGLEQELDELVASNGDEISAGTSLYLYAVVPSADARRAVLPEGVVPGRTVETIEDGELAAVVSRVDASRISAGAEDVKAVTSLARRHDDVLTALAGQATIVPFRSGTVCASKGTSIACSPLSGTDFTSSSTSSTNGTSSGSRSSSRQTSPNRPPIIPRRKTAARPTRSAM
jgi:hypothetical protein